jgi:hypothetical protein
MSEEVAPVSGHDGTPEGMIVALKARPGEAAVTFYENVGIHSHVVFNPENQRFYFEVHTTAVLPWDEEQVLNEEGPLTAEEVVIRLQILQTKDLYQGIHQAVPMDVAEDLIGQLQMITLAAELETFLGEN